MKKILLVLFAVTLTTALFVATGPSVKAEEVKTFIGTIESFPCGFGQFKSGPPLWPVGMIVVKADNGEKNNFLIVRDGLSATVFYDVDGKVAPVLNNIKGMNDIKAIIGKRVEVKYVVTAETMRYANKQLAISVRYVAADYVPQPNVPGKPETISETITGTSGINTLVGNIEKTRTSFFPTPPRWIFYIITVVADNGEEKEIGIPRGFSNIIDINGKPRWGAPPKKGKVEVKYSVAQDGSNEIVSMRYIP